MSREPTAHELEIESQRRAQLEELRAAAPGMLEVLGDKLTSKVGARGEASRIEAVAIDEGLRAHAAQLVGDPMQRVWWLSRVGVWVALELCRRHRGDWFVDRDPDARTFLRPVVGRFGGREGGPRYDPMQVASVVVDGGESLVAWMSAIEDELQAF